jgi:SpoVK/Ycf46/Vps4 family AAA+-type ATPase
MGPIRDMILSNSNIEADQWDESKIRDVHLKDFVKALKNVKSSVSPDEIIRYKEWNKTFGSFDIVDKD